MALAFLFEDDSVMYIDSVESYSKSYNSNIANHPIDKSAVVTDHVSRDNPSFSLKGVISAADFHSQVTRSNELMSENVDPAYNNPVEGAVITTTSSLLDYLPGSVQQFISSTDPTTVSVDPFRGFSHQVARERLNRAWGKAELITLLDYDQDIATGRSVSVRRVENCLIQNYTDNEDVQTGDSFEFTITLSKTRFAYLKEVDIRVTKAEVADASAGEEDKGDQTQADSNGGDPDDDGSGGTVFRSLPGVESGIEDINSLIGGFLGG